MRCIRFQHGNLGLHFDALLYISHFQLEIDGLTHTDIDQHVLSDGSLEPGVFRTDVISSQGCAGKHEDACFRGLGVQDLSRGNQGGLHFRASDDGTIRIGHDTRDRTCRTLRQGKGANTQPDDRNQIQDKATACCHSQFVSQ